MHDPDRRAGTGQHPADVHQAGGISAAATTLAPESTMARTLSLPIASEVSAFLTENVPPKPQHWSASGELDEREAIHGRQQPLRSVTDPETADRVAGGMERDAVREDRPDVRHPEDVGRGTR